MDEKKPPARLPAGFVLCLARNVVRHYRSTEKGRASAEILHEHNNWGLIDAIEALETILGVDWEGWTPAPCPEDRARARAVTARLWASENAGSEDVEGLAEDFAEVRAEGAGGFFFPVKSPVKHGWVLLWDPRINKGTRAAVFADPMHAAAWGKKCVRDEDNVRVVPITDVGGWEPQSEADARRMAWLEKDPSRAECIVKRFIWGSRTVREAIDDEMANAPPRRST